MASQPHNDPCSAVDAYAWDTRIARAVCLSESGGNPNAYQDTLNADGSNDAGLMGINSIHVASGLIGDKERFDPQANMRSAWAIYQGAGWGAWASYNSGAYKKHL